MAIFINSYVRHYQRVLSQCQRSRVKNWLEMDPRTQALVKSDRPWASPGFLVHPLFVPKPSKSLFEELWKWEVSEVPTCWCHCPFWIGILKAYVVCPKALGKRMQLITVLDPTWFGAYSPSKAFLNSKEIKGGIAWHGFITMLMCLKKTSTPNNSFKFQGWKSWTTIGSCCFFPYFSDTPWPPVAALQAFNIAPRMAMLARPGDQGSGILHIDHLFQPGWRQQLLPKPLLGHLLCWWGKSCEGRRHPYSLC